MKLSACAVAAAAMTCLMALPAGAQDLSATITCLHGTVAARDYASLDQNLREKNWDNSGGVSLASSVGGLKLRVLDPDGTSVCQQTANTSTSCRFRLDLGAVETFNIVVDNVDVNEPNDYKICAY